MPKNLKFFLQKWLVFGKQNNFLLITAIVVAIYNFAGKMLRAFSLTVFNVRDSHYPIFNRIDVSNWQSVSEKKEIEKRN